MDWTDTLVGLGVCIAVVILAAAMHRRPSVPGSPKMVPWVFIMFAGVVGALVFGAHVLTLATGKTWTGGTSF